MKTTMLRAALGVVAVSVSVSAFATATITNDFESMSLGHVPGGLDARAPGNGLWYNPDNSASYGEVKDGIGRSGSRGIEIGNRGNANDGVIDNVKSARLLETAGESVAPVNATNNIFRSSYWFRTASTQAIVEVAGNVTTQFRFRSETWGPDRTTFFRVNNDSAGNLFASVTGMDDTGNFVAAPNFFGLNWGDWYRVSTEVVFNDGPAANDVVTHRIFDSTNSLLWTHVGTSWEQGARLFGYNGGNIFGVDAVQFHTRGGFAGAHAFVDDLSYEAVPEPMTLTVLALGALLARRKRKA